MHIAIPDYLFVGDDVTALKIAVWDAAKSEWSTDYITFGKDEAKKDARQINFSTTKFAPMSMLQSRCTDYPYQNWWLRCINEDTALLDLWTKRVKLIFEITPLHLRLIECDIPELKHIVDKAFVPGYLLMSTRQAERVIDNVARANVKLQFDTYHLQIQEGDLVANFLRCQEKIGHLQCSSLPGRNEPDSGEVAHQWLFERFDDAGYGDWIGCEYRPRGATLDGLDWAEPYGIVARPL